jgi:hypothetical protein
MQSQVIPDSVWFDNAVIKPPETDYEETRYTRVVIDSKDRDISVHPTPSAYNISLQDEIEDVVAAQLIACNIPLSGYMVTSNHNSFGVTISPGATVYTVTLDDGDYTGAELATELAAKINVAVGGGSNFSVSYAAKTGKFLFTHASANFSLIFNTDNANSLARVLGFKPATTAASAARTLLSPARANLDYFKYVVMYIDQFSNNQGSSSVLAKSFAVIYDNTNRQNDNDITTIVKKFTPPLSRLTRLLISFYDRDGKMYDFNGVDHTFEILFKSYKQKRKYNSMGFGR